MCNKKNKDTIIRVVIVFVFVEENKTVICFFSFCLYLNINKNIK